MPLRRLDILSYTRIMSCLDTHWRHSISKLAKARLPSAIVLAVLQVFGHFKSDEYTGILEHSESSFLYLEGYLEWLISSENQCDLGPIKKARPKRVYIGVTQPATARLSEHLTEWPGYDDLPRSTGIFLGIFALGWSYVLSTRLIELRRTTVKDEVFYTGIWATSNNNDSSSPSIDLEKCAPAEAQWSILDRDGGKYYSPWACHLNSATPINLRYCTSLPFSKDASPPSYSQAQAFLFNLARHPRHSRLGFPIVLPGLLKPPSITLQDLDPYYEDKLPSPDEIPHFMFLSSTIDAIASCLGSCFWDESITSNLFIPRLPQKHMVNTLVHIMARRRPEIASICLGSAISGFLPHIFQVCRSHILRPSLKASAWVRSPQSSMDPQKYRPVNVRSVADEDLISCEDELRLLWFTDLESETYGVPPLSPYPPAGFVTLRDSSVDVRLHAKCGHKVAYKSRRWMMKGASKSDTSNEECLSSSATRSLFTWTFFTEETRLEDREIWRHEWLRFLLERGWRDGIPAHRSTIEFGERSL
ncbi:hypothetical protein BDW69DRAFT_204224 [Aspergillus filifer]